MASRLRPKLGPGVWPSGPWWPLGVRLPTSYKFVPRGPRYHMIKELGLTDHINYGFWDLVP